MVQPSILSFFGSSSKVNQGNASTTNSQNSSTKKKKASPKTKTADSPMKKKMAESAVKKTIADSPVKKIVDSPLKKETADSPIKKAPRRRTLAIESDSEGEENGTSINNEEKENLIISPSKFPIDDSSKRENLSQSPMSSPLKPSTSKDKLGFSPTTVPPLRKTARKQLKRKSDSMEEKQKKIVKKMKLSPKEKKKEAESSDEEEINRSLSLTNKKKNLIDSDEEMDISTSNILKEEKKSCDDENMEVDKKKVDEKEVNGSKQKTKRNSLDRFFAPKSFQSTKYLSGRDNQSPCQNSSNKSQKSPKKTQPSPAKEEKKDAGLPSDSSNNAKMSPKKEEVSELVSADEDKDEASDKLEKLPKKPSETIKSEDNTEKITKNQNSKVSEVSNNVEEEISGVASESPKKSPNKLKKGSVSSPSTSSEPNKSNDKKCSDKVNTTNQFGLNDSTKDRDDYNPSKSNYNPIVDASWKRGESVPFAALSRTFEIIEETSGRLKTIEILSNFLRSVIVLSPEDLLYCVYLCLNKVAPAFEGIELGMGEIYLCRAIAQVTGRSVAMIKSDITEKGDLGIVAELSKSNQRTMFQPARLTVKKVFLNVKEIALMSGQACQAKKIDKIKTMIVACKGSETRFLVRCIGDKLRIGLAEQSILQAIAQACFLTPPNQDYPPEILNKGKGLSAETLKNKVEEHALILKTTYCECPTFDKIIPSLLKTGIEDLPKNCQLEPGIPLKPMLAHPTKGVSEVLKRFENAKFTCEFKYDGERAQIHLSEDGTVNIFSRNQENNTTKYPDIISRIKNSLGPDVTSCIIDSESVAYDVTEKKILPFQILSTRKRKDAVESEIKVQVCVFPFDLLYLNGRNLVQEPFEVRRELLKTNFKEVEGEFLFAKSMDSTNTEDIEEFLEESIKGNCEGLMVKTLNVDATYEIAKRSRNWLKLKKDYLEGVGDTIDVVVIGGYLGKGKRTGTYGGFLLACYDPDNEEFQSLCKIGTGFSDESLQQHTTFFKDHIIDAPKSYYRFDSGLAPDHWFEAVQVWEIKCADLSISPIHKAAIGVVDPEKGISLRFPRFLRIREDKTPENATSASQIAELYQNQDQIKNQTQGMKDEEDFY